MDPWPGWHAHVIEHHLAMLLHRLNAAAQHPMHWHGRQLGEFAGPVLLRFATIVACAVSGWGLVTSLRFLAQLVRACLLYSAGMVPCLVFATFCFYALRVVRTRWLREEWLDFLRQWNFADVVLCPICAEEVKHTPWVICTMPCCAGGVCWACVRRHAQSVMEDARPEMLCPLLPCRKVLPDVLVYTTLRREQWSLKTFDVTGSLARRKWRAYEMWNFTSGLAATCGARLEDVVRCPGDDCGHLWVLPREARHRKGQAEPSSSWNPLAWSLSRQFGLYTPPTAEGGRDLRYVDCPKCMGSYCLLCGMAWSVAPRVSHQGKSCVEHGKHFPNKGGAADQYAGAKQCPSCGVRIIRSMGCNHMTCTQCGGEWCWVCKQKWTATHYGCNPDRSQFGNCAVQ